MHSQHVSRLDDANISAPYVSDSSCNCSSCIFCCCCCCFLSFHYLCHLIYCGVGGGCNTLNRRECCVVVTRGRVSLIIRFQAFPELVSVNLLIFSQVSFICLGRPQRSGWGRFPPDESLTHRLVKPQKGGFCSLPSPFMLCRSLHWPLCP